MSLVYINVVRGRFRTCFLKIFSENCVFVGLHSLSGGDFVQNNGILGALPEGGGMATAMAGERGYL